MSDTELLEKIVQNTEPKTSTQKVVSDNSTKIKTTFYPTIELDKTRKYEMPLVNLEMYYSFPNIDSSNNVFRYSPGSSQQRYGLIFVFQKVVTISLTLQKQSK